MFSLLEALRETCFRKPEVNICVLGLDGAGKTTVLERADGRWEIVHTHLSRPRRPSA